MEILQNTDANINYKVSYQNDVLIIIFKTEIRYNWFYVRYFKKFNNNSMIQKFLKIQKLF